MLYLFCINVTILCVICNALTTLRMQTKNTFMYKSNDTYWESITDFIPIHNQSYGSIKLGRSVRCEYKFIYHSRSHSHINKSHENAFRIGHSHTVSNKADGAGSRYPSMWIYYEEEKPQIPHLKFAVSNRDQTWTQFVIHRIEKEQIYSVLIKFNQTYIFISVSNTKTMYSHIIVDGLRSAPTSQKRLDTFMDVWISQFGHGDVPTPAANITMFNMTISTWNPSTDISPNPSMHPALQPSNRFGYILHSTMNPTMKITSTEETEATVDKDDMQISDDTTQMDNVTMFLLLGSIIIFVLFCGFVILLWCMKFKFFSKESKIETRQDDHQTEIDTLTSTKEVEQKNNKIFGLDGSKLSSTFICNKDYKSAIPKVLIKLKKELFDNDGHLTEGIFRIAANKTLLENIVHQINDGKLKNINFRTLSAALIADLTKLWFRELTHPLCECVVEMIKMDSSQIGNILNNMIEPHKSYFVWLLDLCIDIIEYEAINKMGKKAMSIIFAPNMYDPLSQPINFCSDMISFFQLAIEWRENKLDEQASCASTVLNKMLSRTISMSSQYTKISDDESVSCAFEEKECELYHEKQELEMCLLHAINALLQKKQYTSKSLDAICKELAPNKIINPHKSILQTGNYDVNVLLFALKKIDIDVQWFDSRKVNELNLNNKQLLEPDNKLKFIGFILNNPHSKMFKIFNRRHWLTIKKIGSFWYNFDSKLNEPMKYDDTKQVTKFLKHVLQNNNAELMICRHTKRDN